MGFRPGNRTHEKNTGAVLIAKINARSKSLSDKEQRVLLVEQSSAWVNRFSRALMDRGYAVSLAASVEDAGPADIVVIGLSGLQEMAVRGGAARKQYPNSRLVVMVSERDIAEARESLATISADGAIVRGGGIWRTATELEHVAFAHRRQTQRYDVRLKTSVTHEGIRLRGSIRDLAAGGALIVLSRKSVVGMTCGAIVRLSFKSPADGGHLEWDSIVRRISVRRTLFGKRPALGVQFSEIDKEQASRFEELLFYFETISRMRQHAAAGGGHMAV